MVGLLDSSIVRALAGLRTRSGSSVYLRRRVDGTEALSIGHHKEVVTFPPDNQSPEVMCNAIDKIANEGSA